MKSLKNIHGYRSFATRQDICMSKDQAYGVVIFVISVVGIILYGWFVYGWPLITLQITAFLAVALILVIAAWIGYTMATTPPPAPLEPVTTSTSEPTGTASSMEGKAEGAG
jgi:predicted DNA-binding transcriptional regulator